MGSWSGLVTGFGDLGIAWSLRDVRGERQRASVRVSGVLSVCVGSRSRGVWPLVRVTAFYPLLNQTRSPTLIHAQREEAR